MSVLTCQVCGGTLTVEASGQIQCTLCGVTYTKETLQTLSGITRPLRKASPSPPIEGRTPRWTCLPNWTGSR